jgi:hypothetical protein
MAEACNKENQQQKLRTIPSERLNLQSQGRDIDVSQQQTEGLRELCSYIDIPAHNRQPQQNTSRRMHGMAPRRKNLGDRQCPDGDVASRSVGGLVRLSGGLHT